MQQERDTFIDTARLAMLALGVFYHAGLMFDPAAHYVVSFDTRSQLIATFCGLVHVFRMQAFFVIAAFLAAAVLSKYSAAAFLEKRAVRLLVPFAVAAALINPIAEAAVAGQPLVDAGMGGAMHLWFIPVLFACAVIHQLVLRPGQLAHVLPRGLSAPAWLMVPAVIAAAAAMIWAAKTALALLPLQSVSSLSSGYFNATLFAEYLPFYAAGAALFHYRTQLDQLLKWAPLLLPFVALNFSGMRALNESPALSQLARDAASLALVVMALAFFRHTGRLARPWMSNFSYTLYLLHLPLLIVLRQPVMDNIEGVWARFFLINAATIALCAGAHVLITRSHALSFLLNGETARLQPAPVTKNFEKSC